MSNFNIPVRCPTCNSEKVVRAGKSALGEQRYRCQVESCPKGSFMLNYRYSADKSGVKEPIVDLAINGSGVRDTARVLKISKGTVISALKKACGPCPTEPAL
jgi:transposase-like protein